jgi:hypothetical protein
MAGICEILDDTQYLDSALLVNSPPAPFTPPGGKGPLWFIPSQTVTLMDQSTRTLGTYQIDANAAYNQDDNATLAPPLREEVQRWRPLGRYFDPRVCVIKDTPGPLIIPEITLECST